MPATTEGQEQKVRNAGCQKTGWLGCVPLTVHTIKISEAFSSKLDCNYTFPIDLAPNGIPFGVKSIGVVLLQSCSGLDRQDRENICVRVPDSYAPEA